MDSKKASRRLFLKSGAALAGAALGAGRAAGAQADTATAESGRGSGRDLRAYGERSHFETMRRTGNNGMYGPDALDPGARRDIGLRAPLQDMMGNITPASVHYTI